MGKLVFTPHILLINVHMGMTNVVSVLTDDISGSPTKL